MTRIAMTWGLILVACASTPGFAAGHDCYVGIDAGGAFGLSRQHNSSGADVTEDFDVKGGALGGNLGCLWKANRNGYGVEADFSGLRAKGSTHDQAPPSDPTFTSETRVEHLAMLRGILGYETRPNWFVYAAAGIATAIGTVSACPPAGDCASDSKRLWGLTGGIGVEYALTPALRMRLEYLYLGFAKKKFMDPAPAGFVDRGGGVEADLNLVRAGVALHF